MKKISLIIIQLIIFLGINAQNHIRYTTVDLNMRSMPNTSSKVLLVIPQGTSVTIDDDCDCKWIPINYKGKIGYVSTKYISKEKASVGSSYHSTVKHYTNSRGERVQSPTYYNSPPPGATALCRDGTYSFSRSRRGTCSHHGGVQKWL